MSGAGAVPSCLSRKPQHHSHINIHHMEKKAKFNTANTMIITTVRVNTLSSSSSSSSSPDPGCSVTGKKIKACYTCLNIFIKISYILLMLQSVISPRLSYANIYIHVSLSIDLPGGGGAGVHSVPSGPVLHGRMFVTGLGFSLVGPGVEVTIDPTQVRRVSVNSLHVHDVQVLPHKELSVTMLVLSLLKSEKCVPPVIGSA